VNWLFLKNKKANKGYYEALGGIFYLLAILGSIAAVFYFIFEKRISVPMWPRNLLLVFGALIILLLFARTEMIFDIITKKRDLKKSLATFLGPLGIHFSSLLVTVGILLPLLKGIMSLPLAIFLTALTFPLYHFCQFYFFPEGQSIKFQFQIFSYTLLYVLFYQLTNSFMLTFLLQHLVAVTTFIYNKDYDFGEMDMPFYVGILAVFSSILFAVIYFK
jgi:hypothetical protein